MRVVFLHLVASVILIVIGLQNQQERFEFMPEIQFCFHTKQEIIVTTNLKLISACRIWKFWVIVLRLFERVDHSEYIKMWISWTFIRKSIRSYYKLIQFSMSLPPRTSIKAFACCCLRKGTQIMEISFAFTSETKTKPVRGKNLSISHLCRIYCLFYVELLIVCFHCSVQLLYTFRKASSINDQKRGTVPNMTRAQLLIAHTKRGLVETYRNLLHHVITRSIVPNNFYLLARFYEPQSILDIDTMKHHSC